MNEQTDHTAALTRRVDNLTALLEISRELGADMPLDRLLRRIEQAALRVLDCERVTIFLYDRARQELHSRLATGAGEIRFPADRGIAGEALQAGQPINISDPYDDPRFNPAIDRETGFRTRNLLTLPMNGHEGSAVAVLQLVNKRGGAFMEDDERLARTLASLTGVALQRQMLLEAFAVKQRMERDLAVARQIQQSLLPRSNPSVEGFDIAGWNKPADETGGDFYDFVPLPDGRLGLLLADASGHGIGPAMVAAECRALVRALATTTRNLEAILTGANALLNADLEPGRFITVFLGLLDPADGTVEYVSGGQAPLLLYRNATDTAVTLDATTMPLGILPVIDGTSAPPLAMEPGDVLILVTDGFHEWAGQNEEEFGINRIFKVVRSHPGHSASQLIQALYEEIVVFVDGALQDDDLTAIVVKKR